MGFLLFFGKSFGFSGNFRTICAACGAGKKVNFFSFNWKKQRWNLYFMAGSLIGGFITKQWLWDGELPLISSQTKAALSALGFDLSMGFQPEVLFSFPPEKGLKQVAIWVVGGLLIGFGTRWAGGCTSGHAISGLSDLQLPSLIAVIGFFIGGLLMTHVLFPIIFPL